MRKCFKKPFDKEWCYALYVCYESGDDDVLGELLEGLCPLVRLVYVKVSRPLGDQAAVESDALFKIYETITSRCIPDHTVSAFVSFLRTIIVRSISDSYRDLKAREFDFSRFARYPHAKPFKTHEDVELSLYKRQLRRAIREEVLSKIRFIEDERDACEFIVDALLGYRKVDPRLAIRKYKLSVQRCKYLIRCMEIMIKAAAYEQREQECEDGTLAYPWSSSGSLLHSLG